MPDYSPPWLTRELRDQLASLTRKQRNTILRLAEAEVTGAPWTEVWARRDCCSKTTWYGRYRRSGEKIPGWQDQPAIADALTTALALANDYTDSQIGRDIHAAQLQLAAEALASVTRLVHLRDHADTDETQRKAANDILAMTVGRIHKLGVEKTSVDPFLDLLRELRDIEQEEPDGLDK